MKGELVRELPIGGSPVRLFRLRSGKYRGTFEGKQTKSFSAGELPAEEELKMEARLWLRAASKVHAAELGESQ